MTESFALPIARHVAVRRSGLFVHCLMGQSFYVTKTNIILYQQALQSALISLVIAVLIGTLTDHLKEFHRQKLRVVTENICSCDVEEALAFVQRRQLLRAQQELLDLDNCTTPYNPATGYIHIATKSSDSRNGPGNHSAGSDSAAGHGETAQKTIESNRQKMTAAIEANKRKLSYYLFQKELQSRNKRFGWYVLQTCVWGY